MTPIGETRALIKSIRRIARAAELQSRRVQRDIGLTLPQLVVLGCARDLGEVTTAAISAEADLSPATVVAILDKLEEKRLIERYRSTRDRRIVHTRLTEAGSAILADAPPLLGAGFDAGFGHLPPAVREATLAAFGLVADLAAGPDAPDASFGDSAAAHL